jgi:hypothetical protein
MRVRQGDGVFEDKRSPVNGERTMSS